jgi:hypothetical protein
MKLTDEEMQIFDIAYKLHLPVYIIMDEMSYEEFLGWIAYFDKQPPGWQEDYRTSLIMRSFGAEIKPEDVFPSLRHIQEVSTIGIKGLTGSVMFTMMQKAVDGDKIV